MFAKKIGSAALLLAVLLSGPAAFAEPEVEPPAPPLILPAPTPSSEKKELQVESEWLDRGVSRLHLEGQGQSGAVRAMSLDVGYKGESWMARLKGEGDLLDKAAKVTVEGSLFGRDHWQASHKVMLTQAPSVTEVSVGVDLTSSTSLRLMGTQSVEASQLGGGFSCRAADGVELGATLRARKLDLAGGNSEIEWRNPAIEGNFRWSW